MQRILSIVSFTILGLLLSASPIMGKSNDGSDKLKSAAAEGEKIWGPHSTREKLFLDLDDCIERALAFNRAIKAEGYAVRKAKARYGEADIIGRPILEYEHLLGPVPKDVSKATESFFTGDITILNRSKIGLGIPLATFGKIDRAKKLANQGIEAAEEGKVKKTSEVVYKVKQIYYGILLARETKRLLESAYKQSDKEIRKREEKGRTDPVELLKLKIFRSDMDKKTLEANNREILALEALRTLIGLDGAQSFDVKRTRLRPLSRKLEKFDHYQQVAYQQRADVKLLRIGLRSSRLNYELEKRRYAPDLGMGGFFEIGRAPGVEGLTADDDFNDPFNFTRAGVGLRLEGKFDLGGRTAKIRQAEADMLKAEVQGDLALQGIMLEVKKAYLNVQSAERELERAEETSKLARQLLFLTQSNFDIGLSEAKDLIDAISQFLLTRGEYFKAVFDLNVAFAELDQKVDEIPDRQS